MKKESVNKFDLEAAFKALEEIEVPVVKGIKPNRENLQEKFTKKSTTEILVEEVIKIASKMNKPKILDLCTGSGAIAISIAKNVPEAEVHAIDISSKALEIAKKNAKSLGVKVKFTKSNLFEKLNKTKEKKVNESLPKNKKIVQGKKINNNTKKEKYEKIVVN